MKIAEYQLKSIRTMKIDENIVPHCVMGVSGEVGEVIDMIKKHIYYGKELDKHELEEEIGDVMFYLTNLATAFNLSMENILEGNIEKLMKRYPDGFTKEHALERLDKNE